MVFGVVSADSAVVSLISDGSSMILLPFSTAATSGTATSGLISSTFSEASGASDSTGTVVAAGADGVSAI